MDGKITAAARFNTKCIGGRIQQSRTIAGYIVLETELTRQVFLPKVKFGLLAENLRTPPGMWRGDPKLGLEDANRVIGWLKGKTIKVRRVRREAPYEFDPTQTMVMFDDYFMEVVL